MTGLFFFIRASVKDRTERIQFEIEGEATPILNQLQTYFEQRAYRVTQVNPQKQGITFEGYVRPSWFLAIFLSSLAGIGLVCFALALGYLFPSVAYWFLALLLLAPIAGRFYWQYAGRLENVVVQLQTPSQDSQPRFVTITAHRDELIQLQQTFPWKVTTWG